jgi:deoxyribose-phosphate aldolase
MDISVSELAASIDQTLLRPTAGFAEGALWIEGNRDWGFASLCVSPFLVPVAAQVLSGTQTQVCSVVGFPLGFANTESKAAEAKTLVELGCTEVDMVINLGALREGENEFVRDDISAVVASVRNASDGRAIVKVILETGYLDDEQLVSGCTLAVEGGADFVKTSTGFGPRGASVHDVVLMRANVGPHIGVKAAGGIRNLEDALALLEAGATRLGTSAGSEIIAEATDLDR